MQFSTTLLAVALSLLSMQALAADLQNTPAYAAERTEEDNNPETNPVLNSDALGHPKSNANSHPKDPPSFHPKERSLPETTLKTVVQVSTAI